MSVWVCIPSARPVPEVTVWCERWHAMGYKIALWRDDDIIEDAEICIMGGPRGGFGEEGGPQLEGYPGWPIASNRLIDAVLSGDRSCNWVVCGGDDTYPDPNKRADEIAAECSEHFSNMRCPVQGEPLRPEKWNWPTFGVMQPTGDRWGDDAYSRKRWPDAPAMIDRICGSPWIGREFALRINGGQGPWWPEYFHNWADEEMQCVAKSLGVLWQRRDLMHYHDHARRNGGPWQPHQRGFDEDYRKMSPLFAKRQAEGFPGSAPL